MLENFMVCYGTRWSGHPNDPNAPEASGCDVCGRPERHQCAVRSCEKALCDDCCATCAGCGQAYCSDHAHLLNAYGRCEKCELCPLCEDRWHEGPCLAEGPVEIELTGADVAMFIDYGFVLAAGGAL